MQKENDHQENGKPDSRGSHGVANGSFLDHQFARLTALLLATQLEPNRHCINSNSPRSHISWYCSFHNASPFSPFIILRSEQSQKLLQCETFAIEHGLQLRQILLCILSLVFVLVGQ
mmetsp:Transcript_4388/g.16557  ORF Transcript_4388/g.16557 Transcript_4388/m.16557 type:complete len:117 (+) Transcript_4388:3562-3912(+)